MKVLTLDPPAKNNAKSSITTAPRKISSITGATPPIIANLALSAAFSGTVGIPMLSPWLVVSKNANSIPAPNPNSKFLGKSCLLSPNFMFSNTIL